MQPTRIARGKMFSARSAGSKQRVRRFVRQDKIRATARSQTIENVTSIPFIEVSVDGKHVR